MSKTETVTRRNLGATRRAQNGNGNSGPSLESAEAGQAWDDRKSRKGYSSNPIISRRRNVASGRLPSFAIVQRKLFLYMRRNPEKTYMFVVATFAAAFLITLVISASLRTNVDESPASPEQTISHEYKVLSNHNHNHKKLSIHIPVLPQNVPQPSFEILFKGVKSATETILIPKELGPEESEFLQYTDYGDLEIEFFEYEGVRNIFHDYSLMEGDFRPHTQPQDDDIDMYYAFDDDYLRSGFTAVDSEDERDGDKLCRRTSEHRMDFQNCNSFHESPLLESNVKYVSAGAYRQVLVFDNNFIGQSEKIIIKDIHYDYDFKYDHVEYVRMDALVAERLTSSPRIYDIYGYCGLGILSEFFPHGDMEDVAVPVDGYITPEKLNDGSELKPQNDLKALQKLEICTQMAEALADLHGNLNGVIVHQDMQLSQFLWNADKSRVKLNDFNRAEYMLWDDEAKDYCRYLEGPGNGNWRSPEEYYDKPVNEQIDVFSLGNNFYSILTGLWPFYDEDDVEEVQDQIMDRKTAYIDPRWKTRSLAEGKIVEIIEKMYAYEPGARPGIFEIVDFLRKALEEAKEKSTE